MRKPRGRRTKGTLNSSMLSLHSVTDSNDISVSNYTPPKQMIPGAGDWNGKAFPLFDELDELLSDQMADERKAISSNHIPQSSGKFVAFDESDEDNTMAAASEECESPLPKEKSKGKRSAQVDIGSATKSRKSSEGVSRGLQSCFETFNRSVSKPPPDKDKEFSRGIVQAMKALHVDSRTYAIAVRELSKDKVLGNIFIESDEAEQRAMIDLYLGKVGMDDESMNSGTESCGAGQYSDSVGEEMSDADASNWHAEHHLQHLMLLENLVNLQMNQRPERVIQHDCPLSGKDYTKWMLNSHQ